MGGFLFIMPALVILIIAVASALGGSSFCFTIQNSVAVTQAKQRIALLYLSAFCS